MPCTYLITTFPRPGLPNTSDLDTIYQLSMSRSECGRTISTKNIDFQSREGFSCPDDNSFDVLALAHLLLHHRVLLPGHGDARQQRLLPVHAQLARLPLLAQHAGDEDSEQQHAHNDEGGHHEGDDVLLRRQQVVDGVVVVSGPVPPPAPGSCPASAS